MEKYLFLDRDGTLIEEPRDLQIDHLSKFSLLPGTISALMALKQLGFKFVMISNQDGLGTKNYPQNKYDEIQTLLRQIFKSEGLEFEAELICPHLPEQNCKCRKPKTSLLKPYLQRSDWSREDSVVIGDRVTDGELAENLGVGFQRIGREGKSWSDIVNEVRTPKKNNFRIKRITKETKVDIQVLPFTGKISIRTGLPFFDHMLHQLVFNAGLSVDLQAMGDLEIDCHHLVEDVAIAFGQALAKMMGSRNRLARYGQALIPMDEALALSAVDLAARTHFRYRGPSSASAIHGYRLEMLPHFFQSLAENARLTLHLSVRGENLHHVCEVAHKSVGRSLRKALTENKVPENSTKGVLL